MRQPLIKPDQILSLFSLAEVKLVKSPIQLDPCMTDQVKLPSIHVVILQRMICFGLLEIIFLSGSYSGTIMFDLQIQRLGGVDSDFAPFLQHAGIPSIDIYYGRGMFLLPL
jgi:hypothetical protein